MEKDRYPRGAWKKKCNISSWCKLKDGLQSSLDTLFFMHVEYHQITDVNHERYFQMKAHWDAIKTTKQTYIHKHTELRKIT